MNPNDSAFFDGNNKIEEAIAVYRVANTEENLIAVLEQIRLRMHGEGQFILPVIRGNEDKQKCSVRTIRTEDGKDWLAAFTSGEEYEKGPKSELLTNSIAVILHASLEGKTEGLILNPWGKTFFLTNGMIKALFTMDKKQNNKLTKADLEGGKLLKTAIQIFKENQTKEAFLSVLQILRDSYVWIPCHAVLGEKDLKALEEMAGNADSEKDMNELVGQTFSNQESIRLIPDILQNGDAFYFPVFSSAEEMGDYGKRFSKVEKHLLAAIQLAKNNERELKGIVVNAFSGPFVLTKELFEVVEKLESSLADDPENRKPPGDKA